MPKIITCSLPLVLKWNNWLKCENYLARKSEFHFLLYYMKMSKMYHTNIFLATNSAIGELYIKHSTTTYVIGTQR